LLLINVHDWASPIARNKSPKSQTGFSGGRSVKTVVRLLHENAVDPDTCVVAILLCPPPRLLTARRAIMCCGKSEPYTTAFVLTRVGMTRRRHTGPAASRGGGRGGARNLDPARTQISCSPPPPTPMGDRRRGRRDATARVFYIIIYITITPNGGCYNNIIFNFVMSATVRKGVVVIVLVVVIVVSVVRTVTTHTVIIICFIITLWSGF